MKYNFSVLQCLFTALITSNMHSRQNCKCIKSTFRLLWSRMGWIPLLAGSALVMADMFWTEGGNQVSICLCPLPVTFLFLFCCNVAKEPFSSLPASNFIFVIFSKTVATDGAGVLAGTYLFVAFWNTEWDVFKWCIKAVVQNYLAVVALLILSMKTDHKSHI